MQSLKSPVGNRLIANLSKTDRGGMLGHCTAVKLRRGAILGKANRPMRQLYFPLASIISLTTEVGNHQSLATELVGNEGMLGATLLLDTNMASVHARVLIAGAALRITPAQLRRDMDASPALRSALSRYLYSQVRQLALAAACIHFHSIELRLSRWLLMLHDRSCANAFYITHEALAGLLGVRRSSISVAASALQSQRLIHYSRGNIRILNRPALESAACACYAAMAQDVW